MQTERSSWSYLRKSYCQSTALPPQERSGWSRQHLSMCYSSMNLVGWLISTNFCYLVEDKIQKATYSQKGTSRYIYILLLCSLPLSSSSVFVNMFVLIDVIVQNLLYLVVSAEIWKINVHIAAPFV